MIYYPINLGCAIFSFLITLWCISTGNTIGVILNAACVAFNLFVAFGGFE